jgi:hypothetical protein
MPLVIFFVSDPAKGIAEMARVVSPGGLVTAYAWDMPGGGFPYRTLFAELRDQGVYVPSAPSPDASGMDAMRALWTDAGVEALETRVITVERTFADFDDYWTTVLGSASVARILAAMTLEQLTPIKARMKEILPAAADGRITYSATANAIAGRVRQSPS